MDVKKRILVIDDEPMVLSAMKRVFRNNDEFEVETAVSGHEALLKLQHGAFSVVVSDLRMPGMDGFQLLDEVARDFPQIVRIILSGETDNDVITRFPGHAHQFLAKPADHSEITETLRRAIALQALSAAHPGLGDIIAKAGSLPSLPALYHQIMQELQSPECTPGRIGELIIQDIGMTTRLLQLVNSPFFGLSRTISDPVHAARLVGLDILKGLIITSQAFSQFEGTKVSYLSISELTKHSMLAGRTATKILQDNQGSRGEIDDAFTAGLLHDIGKLLLTRILHDEYNEVIEQSREEKQVFWQKEQETLHATHAELGAYLLGLWRLPTVVVEAVARHHVPAGSSAGARRVVGAVHAADIMTYDTDGTGEQLPTGEVDSAYLAEVGVTVDFAACKEFIAGIRNKAQASS